MVLYKYVYICFGLPHSGSICVLEISMYHNRIIYMHNSLYTLPFNIGKAMYVLNTDGKIYAPIDSNR